MRPREHSPGYLPTLDGWRAVAIAGLLMAHAPAFPNWMHLHRYVQMKGPLGVNLFFAISGFLICSRLLGEEAAYGSISIRDFYIRRAFRILPPAITYLLVVALLAALHQLPWEGRSWLAALFFYRNYLHFFAGATWAGWFTSHFWSLSVEEHFYLLLPAIVALLPARRKLLLTSLTALNIAWLGCFLYKSPSGYTVPFWSQRSDLVLCWLLVPALMALLLQSPTVRPRMQHWLTPAAGIVCALVASHLNSMGLPFALVILQPLSLAVLYPLLVISTVFHPQSLLSRILEHPALRFVGRLSYSLYLWQELFFPAGHRYGGFAIHALQRPGLNLLCAFACALASFYLVEQPAIRWGQRFTRRPTTTPARQPIPPVAEPA